jgi:hypothetical protein
MSARDSQAGRPTWSLSPQDLTVSYPRLTREEFLDLPASTPELIAALAVVTRQTGFFKPDRAEAPVGED